jgi:hypothetical protein
MHVHLLCAHMCLCVQASVTDASSADQRMKKVCFVCVRARVRACVCVCVRAWMHACKSVSERIITIRAHAPLTHTRKHTHHLHVCATSLRININRSWPPISQSHIHFPSALPSIPRARRLEYLYERGTSCICNLNELGEGQFSAEVILVWNMRICFD